MQKSWNQKSYLPSTYGLQRLENILPNESFSDFKTERNCKRFDVKKY